MGFSVFWGIWLFLNKARYGKKIIAASSDRELANGLGINVPRLYTVVFAMGSWLAGLMGVFHGPMININLDMGHRYIMTAFAVVVIGGLGNIKGAHIGALILGQLEAFGILYPFFPKNIHVCLYDADSHLAAPRAFRRGKKVMGYRAMIEG